MLKRLCMFCFVVCILGVAARAVAEPIFNPSNGHYYEMVTRNNDYDNWDEARVVAQGLSYLGLQGDLATITSLEEFDFIKAQGSNLAPDWGTVWVGGTVDALGNGYWINGEGAIDDQITPWESAPAANSYVAFDGFYYNNDIKGRTSNCGEMIVEYAAVPEPATAGLLLGSGLGIAAYRRIKKSYSLV